MNFDKILEKLGEFGRYQKIVYFLAVCLPSVSGGAFMVISVFLLGVPDHRCVWGFPITGAKQTDVSLQPSNTPLSTLCNLMSLIFRNVKKQTLYITNIN